MATITKPVLEDRAIAADAPELAEVLEEIFPGLADPFPLCEQVLSFELQHARAAIGVAFQRVMTQELQGYYLTTEIENMDGTTDPFMKPEFVIGRLRNIPLVYGLQNPESYAFELDVTNATKSVMSVHARQLRMTKGRAAGPLFNPTTEIASLQPGMRVVIRKIAVVEGMGRIAAPANVAICGRSVPLDLERLPREETHKGMQGAAQLSGFVESSMLAAPTRFRVTVSVAAGVRGSARAADLPTRACNNIVMRLRQVMDVLDRADAAQVAARAAAASDISSWVAEQPDDDDLTTGKLTLRGETITIVELLRTELNELLPDLAYAGAAEGADTSAIGLIVSRHCDPAELRENVKTATKKLIATFSDLRAQL